MKLDFKFAAQKRQREEAVSLRPCFDSIPQNQADGKKPSTVETCCKIRGTFM